jgi:hypothetical protein
MQRLSFLLPALASAGIVLAGPAFAQTAACTAFKDAMVRSSGDLAAEFVRPLVVSRGAGAGRENYDLVTRARIDGVLRCNGEKFVSFEAKITMPADGQLVARFEKVQEVALVSALKWAQPRAETKVREMAHDAADYLRGSQERGDVAVAGKVEDHVGGGVDLGLMWTLTDRTFIVLTGQ